MRKIIKNVLVFSSYFVYEYIFIYLIIALGIKYNTFGYNQRVNCILIINIVYIAFLIFMYRKELKKDIIDFKENYKNYLSKYISLYLLGVILMGLSNVLLQHITHLEMSGNETAVRTLLKQIPVYMVFTSIIYAPFVEEIIFRKSIRNIIKNKYIFVIISGIIFGLLHISDYRNINEILMGIPYIIMGLDFAYIYYKTNNLFTTMVFHFCHNLILVLIQLL